MLPGARDISQGLMSCVVPPATHTPSQLCGQQQQMEGSQGAQTSSKNMEVTRCVGHACNPMPGRLRQGDHDFQASLGYTVRPYLKNEKEKQNKTGDRMRLSRSSVPQGARRLSRFFGGQRGAVKSPQYSCRPCESEFKLRQRAGPQRQETPGGGTAGQHPLSCSVPEQLEPCDKQHAPGKSVLLPPQPASSVGLGQSCGWRPVAEHLLTLPASRSPSAASSTTRTTFTFLMVAGQQRASELEPGVGCSMVQDSGGRGNRGPRRRGGRTPQPAQTTLAAHSPGPLVIS
jgi:hypothetical protein